MKNTLLLISALSLSTTSFAQNTDTRTQSTPTELDTVKVSADFRQLDLMQIPSAITVVDENAIKQRNADHLESILSLAPNVNFAAGSSRGRYFQIRGIGERSQFIDSVNPSVGLIIDGIDMTGLGGAATLFDVAQVEILRGPQGTAFGANALAGAINIKSKQPTKDTEGYLEAKAGNYNSQSLGGAISGSLNDNMQARFAINQSKTDGYINNIHLNRDDTNNINETVARGQLAWQINPNNDLNISLLKTDINNGYDAFSLDNNRNTYSNNPGQDTQDTTALSTQWKSKLNKTSILEINASSSQTKTDYSYDEDWAFGEYDSDTGNCLTPGTCLSNESVWGYSSTDQYLRDYKRNTVDLRLSSAQEGRILSNSTDWTIGIYTSSKDEDLSRNPKGYLTDLNTIATALYTELNSNLSNTSKLIYGLRIENNSLDFSDSNELDKSKNETLWGGKVTFESLINYNHLGYISIARGFKSGGVNTNTEITDAERTFDTEHNHSFEMGLKSSLLNDELTNQLAIFYIQRNDQQVKNSIAITDSEGTSFIEFYDNATEGTNYGLELETTWSITPAIKWNTSLGYLVTELTEYSYTDKYGTYYNNDGRSQAHAPEWSAASSLSITLTPSLELFLEAEGKDEFYFSDSHDEKSKAYTLAHAKLKYSKDNLSISLNGHNLTNKDYAVRGFGFDNDSRPDNDPSQHIQLAAPRLISLSARYDF